jgi:hypothetical protein
MSMVGILSLLLLRTLRPNANYLTVAISANFAYMREYIVGESSYIDA